jgi:hypothetical protein
VYSLLRRPGVYEETDRNQNRTDHHQRKAVLGLRFSAVALGHGCDEFVGDHTHDEKRNEGAHAGTNVDQTDALLSEAVVADEDARARREE